MSREHVLVVFRGTKTRQIVEEYVQKTGQHPNEVLVVCRDNDNLAQPGDRTVDEAIARLGEIISADEKCPGQQDRITVICNGGTTAQAIPFLMRLVSPAPDAPWYYGLLELLEVQPDGVKCLWGRGRHLCADERPVPDDADPQYTCGYDGRHVRPVN